MKKFLFLSAMVLVFQLQAQNDNAARLSGIPLTGADSTKAWVTGGGLGLDLGNVLIINPRPGAGQNRIGLGGAIGLFANYLKDRFSWDNSLSLNLALEKTGSGVLPIEGESVRIPFKKSIDDLKFNSTAGYKTGPDSKWSYAADFSFRSQLIPSYLGIEDGQVYARSINNEGPFQNSLVSQFFSPARIALGLGFKYDPSAALSIVFTPATVDLIVVQNQYIADLGIHGTEQQEGSTSNYKQTRLAIGAKVGIRYTRKFAEDRVAWSSGLALFSDYLDEPQNVDIDWTNDLAITVFKNLQIAYLSNLYYDDDILSNVTDFDAVGGVKTDIEGNAILRPAVNYYHQLVLRYSRVF